MVGMFRTSYTIGAMSPRRISPICSVAVDVGGGSIGVIEVDAVSSFVGWLTAEVVVDALDIAALESVSTAKK